MNTPGKAFCQLPTAAQPDTQSGCGSTPPHRAMGSTALGQALSVIRPASFLGAGWKKVTKERNWPRMGKAQPPERLQESSSRDSQTGPPPRLLHWESDCYFVPSLRSTNTQHMEGEGRYRAVVRIARAGGFPRGVTSQALNHLMGWGLFTELL